jgi:hypothetical protein
LSVDPLVDETGAPYAYADDNPVDRLDPFGQFGCSPSGFYTSNSSGSARTLQAVVGAPAAPSMRPGTYVFRTTVDGSPVITVVTVERLSTSDAVDLVDPTISSIVTDQIASEITDHIETALLGESIAGLLGELDTYQSIQLDLAALEYDDHYGKAGIKAVKSGAPTYVTTWDTFSGGIGRPWEVTGIGAELSVGSHAAESTVNGKPV